MEVRPNPLEHGRYWDATLNVVGGCAIVDSSCLNCYAVPYATGIHAANDVELYRGTTEWRNGHWTWNERTTVLPLNHPNYTAAWSWRGAAEPLLGKGKPSILWLNSMADIFYPARLTEAIVIEAIDYFLENVAISDHIGLILTKHPAQMVAYFRAKPNWWRRKFWLGFSAGDQRWWDRRWQLIRPLAEQGWFIFTSIQPMLGPVVLAPDFRRLGRWVICGGEQHPGHREMDPDWARSLRGQCAGRLPFFVKQMTTGWLPLDLLFREFPKV
jgi:protein gp37